MRRHTVVQRQCECNLWYILPKIITIRLTSFVYTMQLQYAHVLILLRIFICRLQWMVLTGRHVCGDCSGQ